MSMSGGKIFQQLLVLLHMIVAAMDDVMKQEAQMYDACTTLLQLGKIKPDNKICQKKSENIGQACFFIPSMQMIKDHKTNFTT